MSINGIDSTGGIYSSGRIDPYADMRLILANLQKDLNKIQQTYEEKKVEENRLMSNGLLARVEAAQASGNPEDARRVIEEVLKNPALMAKLSPATQANLRKLEGRLPEKEKETELPTTSLLDPEQNSRPGIVV